MKFGEYYCNERTLDVELGWGGITIRIWFDAKSPYWDVASISGLAHYLRRQQARVHLETFVDEIAAKEGVNAVQVRRQHTTGVFLGVMAYMVPFENTEVVEHAAPDEPTAQKVLDAMANHPCLTSDCKHLRRSECNVVLADSYREAFNK